METDQTTGLTIIITGPGCCLSPRQYYCEYQDTMTMMFTAIIMASSLPSFTNNQLVNYIIMLPAR